MPDWFPSWTGCSAPANYRGSPLKDPAFWFATVFTSVLGIVAAFLGAIGPGVAWTLASLTLRAIQFCDWWLNVRLICLGGDRSAVGVIYHLEPPPTPSATDEFNVGDYDTDYSFNLLLWPFAPADVLPDDFVANEWDPNAVDGDLWPGVAATLGAPPIPGGREAGRPDHSAAIDGLARPRTHRGRHRRRQAALSSPLRDRRSRNARI